MKSEFEFIEMIRARYKLSKIGDDCAVLPKDSRTDSVITTDLLVEDVDFRLEWATPEFLGYKTLAVSLSDVAAMGARPVWAMLSIGIPEKIWKTDFVERFYAGWFELAKKFDVELVGGDISKTPAKIVFDSIAAGEVRKGAAVLRSSAKIGDLLYVTGALGGAAAGLQLLETGEKHTRSKHRSLLLRQLKPDPQTEIGQILSSKNLATAMIDVSDGLISDLNHICRESRVGAVINAAEIPDQFDRESISSVFGASEIKNFILNGGEDYELLFAVDPQKKILLEKQLKNRRFSRIGTITAKVGTIEIVADKKTSVIKPEGFRHF